MKAEFLRDVIRPLSFFGSLGTIALLVFSLFMISKSQKLCPLQSTGLFTKWIFLFVVLVLWLITIKQNYIFNLIRNTKLLIKISERFIRKSIG